MGVGVGWGGVGWGGGIPLKKRVIVVKICAVGGTCDVMHSCV